MVPSIQGRNAQVQIGIQTEESSFEAPFELTGSLDALEKAEVILDKAWESLSDVSFATQTTNEWRVGNVDMMSEDLEVEVGKLEVLPEDRGVLSEALEYFSRVLKVLKKSFLLGSCYDPGERRRGCERICRD